MRIRAVLDRLLSGGEPEMVVECRQCGLTLSPGTDTCPACDSGEIGHYRISE